MSRSCNISEQVTDMASSKYKVSLRKKLNSELRMVVSSLRKENVYLKKTLVEMSHQHSEHYKLVERFLSLETARLENSQQRAEGDKTALPSEQCSERGGNQMDVVDMRRQSSISSYAGEIEEIKNKIGRVSTKCQNLEKKFEGKKNFKSNAQGSITCVQELQNHLRDALEKNKQWLEYDQQREAYVRGILARMLWLEKQLNEANQARSQQHKEDHSDDLLPRVSVNKEKTQIVEMQEHYETLLQKAKDELEVLRKEVDMTHQNLRTTQNWCIEREIEVEELKQQLNKRTTEGDCCSKNEDLQLKDLQCRLDEEKRRAATFELQANLIQKFMVNRHHADQEKIAELERQIKISSQDLEDERQDCSYLTKQMIRILKTLQKNRDHVTKESERDQQDHNSCEATGPPAQLSRQSPTSSAHSSLLNESLLECPSCQAEYPASHYRELMNHLEICLD
ncbi:centrosomal protein of 55 kDa-like isoform X1 [Anabas testudineus]|nr:centrosomal protein of 55 kDa-like isoform X1 [Anabas testudineus]